jgi:hypothetical protein
MRLCGLLVAMKIGFVANIIRNLKEFRSKFSTDASRTSEHEPDQFERTDKGSLAAHTRRQLQTEPSLAKVD